jgi:transposase-like protein
MPAICLNKIKKDKPRQSKALIKQWVHFVVAKYLCGFMHFIFHHFLTHMQHHTTSQLSFATPAVILTYVCLYIEHLHIMEYLSINKNVHIKINRIMPTVDVTIKHRILILIAEPIIL